ncbi:hypothetical protein LNKW23_44940 [Paralimibaculum aggregatum]|uniref:Uncharacterized protein n=1 Tax=Paralimibaculum aggregatum TaxID=3036245 RepID=A0ABQ6LT88_9RHOB|nr:hypothetical protein [Limibaculum sp. NKW23]GMG85276.1 hypothetical protein LNKW23_44940 [Limibaculum sp. NKW23]
MRALIAAALAALIALPAAAEGEFSEGSQVTGWDNLAGRENATFTAKVVDIVCALTGDCPADCGAGLRQMGLIREADGKLVLVAKNRQAAFNGGGADLALYCGQTVAVDGLLVGNPELTDTKLYQIFLVKPEGAADWVKADHWTKAWAAKNPEVAGGEGPWFRRDPAVKAEIEAHGYLGLGLERDREFIEENF